MTDEWCSASIHARSRALYMNKVAGQILHRGHSQKQQHWRGLSGVSLVFQNSMVLKEGNLFCCLLLSKSCFFFPINKLLYIFLMILKCSDTLGWIWIVMRRFYLRVLISSLTSREELIFNRFYMKTNIPSFFSLFFLFLRISRIKRCYFVQSFYDKGEFVCAFPLMKSSNCCFILTWALVIFCIS